MFKRTFIFAAALFATLACSQLPVMAQDDTETTTEAPVKKNKKKAKKEPSPIIPAL